MKEVIKEFHEKSIGEIKFRIIGTNGFKHILQTINLFKRAKIMEEILQMWN